MLICLSVCLKRYCGNVIFSAPIQDKCIKVFVKIPLTNEQLLYNYFVHLSSYLKWDLNKSSDFLGCLNIQSTAVYYYVHWLVRLLHFYCCHVYLRNKIFCLNFFFKCITPLILADSFNTINRYFYILTSADHSIYFFRIVK